MPESPDTPEAGDDSDAEAYLHRAQVLASANRPLQALASLDRAIAIDPDLASAHVDRVKILLRLERNEEALAACDRALELRPDAPGVYCNRGLALRRLNRMPEAIESYDRALAQLPDMKIALIGRADALLALQRYAEAVDVFDRVLSMSPGLYSAYNGRAACFVNLKRYDEALLDCDRMLALRPDDPRAICTRGIILHELSRFEDSLPYFDRAAELTPDDPGVYYNRARAYGAMRRYRDALSDYDKALSLKPDIVDAHVNRGNILLEFNRQSEAIESFDRALAVDPHQGGIRWNKGSALLSFGLSEEALLLFEGRQQRLRNPLPSVPYLGGGDPAGKRLLVQWEQRIGDVIQMLRYVPLLMRRAAECTFQIPMSIRDLVTRSFPGINLTGVNRFDGQYDYRVAYGSLPLALRSFDERNIPNIVPYLVPDPAKAARWEAGYRPRQIPRIGIVWRGNKFPPHRSLPISDLGLLFAHRRLGFIAIQKEIDEEERAYLRRYPNVVVVEKLLKTFDDTAALLATLDLVITIDTSVAHLAGALGKPTWVMLKFGADWRWGIDREDSPWYPTARLFRQPRFGDWASVVRRVVAEIEPAARAALEARSAGDPDSRGVRAP